MNVTDGDAGGIGRGELSQGGGRSKYGESNEGSSRHSKLAYNEFASSRSTASLGEGGLLGDPGTRAPVDDSEGEVFQKIGPVAHYIDILLPRLG